MWREKDHGQNPKFIRWRQTTQKLNRKKMNAYIIAGYRTAVAKSKRGGFRTMRPDDLAAEVIKHLMKQVPNLDPARVDDLIVGNAIPEAEQGMQMARYISLLSLPKNVPGFIINRYCGSGLEAIALASAKVASGMADCVIAGGTESMTMLPMMGHKTVLNYGIASEHPDYYIGMGLTAEEVSKKYNVTRDEQDAFAFASHMKALEAQKAGKFTSQIVPVEVTENYFDAKSGKKQSRSWTVSVDEGPRADTTIEALGKLKPAFAMGGTVTAGNASQTSDGAAFVLVVSEKLVKELHLEPIARMVSYATAGVEPSLMGIGPVEAIPIALKKAGLTLKDIQQIELNEAFAAQSLAVMKTLDIDPTIVNVNGGAIALGHPLGCSGAKLSIQLFNEMRLRNQKYGMVTACVGGGQGVAGIYELL
jgi:acetyl-CoA acyltransferase